MVLLRFDSRVGLQDPGSEEGISLRTTFPRQVVEVEGAGGIDVPYLQHSIRRRHRDTPLNRGRKHQLQGATLHPEVPCPKLNVC